MQIRFCFLRIPGLFHTATPSPDQLILHPAQAKEMGLAQVLAAASALAKAVATAPVAAATQAAVIETKAAAVPAVAAAASTTTRSSAPARFRRKHESSPSRNLPIQRKHARTR